MNILLLGSNGQVGWQLQRSLGVLGTVTALERHSKPLSGDLGDADGLAKTVDVLRPDVIVNAAAYTAVDRAEQDQDAAYAINATACEVLAREATRIGAWLIHYSTDYVFDGSGDLPWTENDAPNPLGVYGKSKLAGEKAIRSHCPRHVILRTSWVFDTWGHNFLKSILRAAMQRDSLDVVADQWGAPTRAALIADVTAHVLRRLDIQEPGHQLAGVYHLAAGGVTNWHDYAQLVVREAIARGLSLRTREENVHPIPAQDYPVAAPRPSNSRLDTESLRRRFDVCLPDWTLGVRAVVGELAAQSRVN
ncbi:MAG: dTDP-4-dehydrorhamnose reductase [Ramlibacter sp.]|nr:dTDP-4-dehydrorhamnose reductase [Ramlibacter sp.]